MSDPEDILPEPDGDLAPRRAGTMTHSAQSQLRKMHVARADALYLLRNAAGEYLHLSASGVTTVRAWAWIGNGTQLKRLRSKGDYSAFRAVVAP